MGEQQFEKSSRYLPSTEAAKLCGVTNDYIARLCKRGRLVGVLEGRVWMVQEESLQRFFFSHRDSSLQQEKIENEYMSSPEASRIYGVSNDYIARLCRQGRLNGRLEGRVWMVESKSLQQIFKDKIRPNSERAPEISKQHSRVIYLKNAPLPVVERAPTTTSSSPAPDISVIRNGWIVLMSMAMALLFIFSYPVGQFVTSSSDQLAAVNTASSLTSVAERFALFTYYTISGLFGTQPTNTLPGTPRPVFVINPNTRTGSSTAVWMTQNVSYPTYSTVIQGVSKDFVNQSLSSLHIEILGTIHGMINSTSHYSDTRSSVSNVTNVTSGSGSLTSVDLTTPLGLSVIGGPITTSGTFALALTAGYTIPLVASTTEWDSKQEALTFSYPLANSSNTISLLFGTTTANSWSQLQQFNANASTTALTISGTAWLPSLAGALLSTNTSGRIVATTSISANYLGAAGSNSQIQFNDSGTFGGSSDFTWNKQGSYLTLASSTLPGSAMSILQNSIALGEGRLIITSNPAGLLEEGSARFVAATDGSYSELSLFSNTGDIDTYIDDTGGYFAIETPGNDIYFDTQANSRIETVAFSLKTSGSAGHASLDTSLLASTDHNYLFPNWTGNFLVSSTTSLHQYANGNIGIATTTPGTLLSLGNTGTDTINLSTTATSTFGYGLNIRTGCYAIGGSCLRIASTTLLSDANTFSGSNNFSTLPTLGTLAGLVAGNNGSLYQVASSTLFGFTPQTNQLAKGNFLVGNDAGVAQATSSIFISSTGLVGIGTTTPGTPLSVTGAGVFTGPLTFTSFNATSTTATSTIQGFLDVNGTGTSATSTFASNLWVKGTLRTGTGTMYLHDTALQSSDGNLVLSRNSTSYINGGNVGIGTTTIASSPSTLTVASTTGSQLALSAGAGIGQWAFRNAGGNLYFATTTVAGTATTTTSALTILGANGSAGVGTTSPWGKFSVNTATLAAGVPSFVVGSSTKTDLVVTQNGYVGIGQTTPSQKLDVNGNIIIENNGGIGFSDYASLRIDNASTANTLAFYTSGVEAMRINNVGAVGIGTSTPGVPLAVSGSALTTTQINSTSGSGVYMKFSTSGTTRAYLGVNSANAFNILDAAGSTDLLTVDTSGNVGIGDATPSAKLQVTGGTLIVANANSPFVSFWDTAVSAYYGGVGTVAGYLGSGTSNDIALGAATSRGIHFYTNSSATESMTITSGGSVGVGTPPSFKFDVAENSNSLWTGHFKNNDSGGGEVYLAHGAGYGAYIDTGTDGGSGTYALNVNKAGTSYLYVSGAGAIVLSSAVTSSGGTRQLCSNVTTYVISMENNQTCGAASSLRYKHDIQDLTSGLFEINRMRPVTFVYNSTYSADVTTHLGFIAEEINALDPRLVIYQEDGVTPNSVQYANITALLAKGIQELDARSLSFASTTTIRIDLLEGRLAQLEGISNANNSFPSLTQWLASATNGIHDIYATVFHAEEVRTNTLCIKKSDATDVCVTGDQLAALLASQSVVPAQPPLVPIVITDISTTTPDGGVTTSNPTPITTVTPSDTSSATQSAPDTTSVPPTSDALLVETTALVAGDPTPAP
jgi:hypothetical protein